MDAASRDANSRRSNAQASTASRYGTKINPCFATLRRSRRRTSRGPRDHTCRHTRTSSTPGVPKRIGHHGERSSNGFPVKTTIRTFDNPARVRRPGPVRRPGSSPCRSSAMRQRAPPPKDGLPGSLHRCVHATEASSVWPSVPCVGVVAS